MDISAILNKVNDKYSFLQFVEALKEDREEAIEKEVENPAPPYGPDAGGWENTRIETFLDSCIRWAQDSDFGEKQGIPQDNHWKKFAVFLYCGKIYE